MKRRTSYRSLLALVIGSLTLLGMIPVSPALAVPPERITIPVDETWGFADCGFPIVGHTEGTMTVTRHLDGEGSLVWVLVNSNLRETVTNPATGESLSTPTVGITRVTVDEEGSRYVARIGLQVRFVVPGEGLVGTRVGRIITRLAEGSPPEVVFEAGIFAPRLREVLCRVLGE